MIASVLSGIRCYSKKKMTSLLKKAKTAFCIRCMVYRNDCAWFLSFVIIHRAIFCAIVFALGFDCVGNLLFIVISTMTSHQYPSWI